MRGGWGGLIYRIIKEKNINYIETAVVVGQKRRVRVFLYEYFFPHMLKQASLGSQ